MSPLSALGSGFAQVWMAHVARTATGSLVAAVWQGILLAAAVGLGLRLLPKTPAAIRFAIWFAVFAVVTALPLISLWPHSAIAPQTPAHRAWLTLDPRWSLGVAAVWVAVSLVRAVTLLAAAHRVRTLWKRATPIEIPPDARLNQTSRPAQLCVSDEVDRPTVIGFFAPKILIPGWLLEKLTTAELEQILLHEASHLGRADDWMNLLQKIALVVFPLNPALAWVERRLCFERELAVDERVLQALAGTAGAAKAYATCLATMAEYRMGRRSLTLALGALGRESELGRRVSRILRRGELMRPLHAKLVLGGAMLGLLGVSVGLERCPQVIGFSTATAKVQGSHEWQSTHSPETAIDEHVLASNHLYRNTLQRETNVAHEVELVASTTPRRLRSSPPQPLRTQNGIDAFANAETVSLGGADRAENIPTTEDRSSSPDQRRVRRVQWVLVTSWQGEDGSHLVLTTAASSNQPGRHSPDAINAEQPSDQVRPYAAVPVQGGWLVFQL